MDQPLYGIALRNQGLGKGVNLESVHLIGKKSLFDVYLAVENRTRMYAHKLPPEKHSDIQLLDGLATAAAFLFIPWGEEGIQYVCGKIYPQSLEDFLRGRAEVLLRKTKTAKYPELTRMVQRLCMLYREPVTETDIVSVCLHVMRVESELFRRQEYYDGSTGLLFARCLIDDARRIQTLPPLLDSPAMMAQLLQNCPGSPRSLTAAQREIIDRLPIFTFLSSDD